MRARDIEHLEIIARCFFEIIAKFEDEFQSRGGICNQAMFKTELHLAKELTPMVMW